MYFLKTPCYKWKLWGAHMKYDVWNRWLKFFAFLSCCLSSRLNTFVGSRTFNCFTKGSFYLPSISHKCLRTMQLILFRSTCGLVSRADPIFPGSKDSRYKVSTIFTLINSKEYKNQQPTFFNLYYHILINVWH